MGDTGGVLSMWFMYGCIGVHSGWGFWGYLSTRRNPAVGMSCMNFRCCACWSDLYSDFAWMQTVPWFGIPQPCCVSDHTNPATPVLPPPSVPLNLTHVGQHVKSGTESYSFHPTFRGSLFGFLYGTWYFAKIGGPYSRPQYTKVFIRRDP